MINIDLFKRDPKERKAYADGFKAGAEVAIRDGCEQALKIWEILNTDTAYQKIEALPSAVRTGKWTIEDCHAATYKYCCSNCKAHHRARYDFCPSCGADMRRNQDA